MWGNRFDWFDWFDSTDSMVWIDPSRWYIAFLIMSPLWLLKINVFGHENQTLYLISVGQPWFLTIGNHLFSCKTARFGEPCFWVRRTPRVRRTLSEPTARLEVPEKPTQIMGHMTYACQITINTSMLRVTTPLYFLYNSSYPHTNSCFYKLQTCSIQFKVFKWFVVLVFKIHDYQLRWCMFSVIDQGLPDMGGVWRDGVPNRRNVFNSLPHDTTTIIWVLWVNISYLIIQHSRLK